MSSPLYFSGSTNFLSIFALRCTFPGPLALRKYDGYLYDHSHEEKDY